MSLVVAAVGAALAALIQSTIVPFVAGGGAELDLVLVLAIIWTVVGSLEGGLVWAFLGGLIIDVLMPSRPLGLTAFILTLAVGATWLIGRAVPRAPYPAIVVAAVVLGSASSALVVVLLGMLTGSATGNPMDAVAPAAVVDGVAAAILAPVGIFLRRRLHPDVERVDW